MAVPDAEHRRDRILVALGSWWAVAAVALVAAFLRVAHIFALRALPLFDRLVLDSEFYDTWASSIAAGDWLGGSTVFFYDPLWSYVLAILYRVHGHDLLAARLLQAALGVGTCLGTAVLARRLAGPIAGTLAALLVAFYRPLIYNEGELEKTALGVFLATATLALLTIPSPRARLAAGMTLGLGTLARGNLLLFGPVAALLLLAEPAAAGTRRFHWRSRPVRHAAIFSAGIAFALTPVALRNHHVCGEWILTTAGGGTNYYTGNNPANTTGGYHSVPFVRPQSVHEEGDFRAEARQRTGRTLGPRELSSYWFREALTFLTSNPGLAVRLHLNKIVLFLSSVELADGWDMEWLGRHSWVLRATLPGLAWILPFAVVGAATLLPRSRLAWLLAAFVATYSATVIAFYVFSRYRIHVVPALVVFAAVGLCAMARWLVARDRQRVGIAVVVAAIVASFSLYGAPLVVDLKSGGDLNSSVNLAGIYMERSQFDQARAVLRDALTRHPNAPAILCRAGEIGLRTGDPAAARDTFRACLAANAWQPDGWYGLGLALEATGDATGAAAAYEEQLQRVAGHQGAAARLGALRGRPR